MAKMLDKVTGCNVINKISKDSTDVFFLQIMGSKAKEPIKHVYYEMIDDKGSVVQIIENGIVAASVAGRLGLDYRPVEFSEITEIE